MEVSSSMIPRLTCLTDRSFVQLRVPSCLVRRVILYLFSGTEPVLDFMKTFDISFTMSSLLFVGSTIGYVCAR